MRIKRNGLIIVAAMCLGLAPMAQADTEMVLHWDFENMTSNIVRDVSDNNNHGTITGTVAQADGLNGQCAMINGTNGYIYCVDNASLNPPYITIECLLCPLAWVDNYANIIIDKGWHKGWGIDPHFWGSEIHFCANIGGARCDFGERGALGNDELKTNEWAHLTITYDGTNICIYKNGGLLRQTQINTGPWGNEDYGSITGRLDSVGKILQVGGIGVSPVIAKIDELKIYAGALTSNEVLNAYSIYQPTIMTQPADQTVTVGQTATFSVTASGPALTYQWQKNGVNIGAANSATYTINPVAAGDAGNYQCLVSNTFGVVTSAVATLTVNSQPAITTEPQSLIRNIGETASFTVTASGTAPLTYQWQKNGANIGSANSATYTINSVVAGDAGNYRCLIANMAGTATSAVATLTVNAPPVIITDPPPSAPTGVSATDGTYTNKVLITWSAVNGATGYEVWRSASDNTNDTASVSNLGTIATTTYDDLTADTTPATQHYWVKAVNAGGASGFSASDRGFLGVVGPLVIANANVGRDVYLNSGAPVTIAVQMMNIEPYIGVEVDWWVVARAGSSWYYLSNEMQWTEFDGNLSNCHPAYQSGLFNLPATEVLNMTGLQTGSYTFWFAVDYPMDGIVNVDGPILVDSVNVIVQ